MDFKEIIKKHNYNEELALFLKQVYDEFVLNYSFEEIIFQAFMDCKVVVGEENCYDFLKNGNYLDEDNTEKNMVDSGNLKRAGGVNHTNPVIKYDKNKNEFYITEIKRIIYVRGNNLSDNVKGVIIHELLHAIKSYINNYEIKENILYEKVGTITKIYELSCDNDIVKQSLLEEYGVGLEEGLTSSGELKIGKKIIKEDYNLSGYGAIRSIVEVMLKRINLEEEFIEFSFTKSPERLYNLIGESLFKELINLFDKIYKLNLKMFSQMFNKEEMIKTKDEILHIFETDCNELKEKIKNKLNCEEDYARVSRS